MGIIKQLGLAMVISLFAGTALADRVNIASDAPVDQSVERLVAAVEQAGAKVFLVVDFAKGSKSVGLEQRPTKLVIFGSPKIGAQALQTGQTLALQLPLRILLFEDTAGQTWALYDDPRTLAPTHGVPADHPAVLQMLGALEKFAAIATGTTTP